MEAKPQSVIAAPPLATQSANVAKARPRFRLRKAVVRLGALGVAVLMALAICEVGLRLAGYSPTYVNAMGSFHEADPVCGHRGRRKFSARFNSNEFDVFVAHDEHGFRRQEHQRPAEGAARRLFAFGDSFTWGWGVGQGETYTDQLSLKMADCRVENFGVNGAGTVAEYELFASECRDQLQSGDVVLVTFFQNDFLDNVTGSRHAEVHDGQVVTQPAHSHLRPSWKRTCQQSSYLFNYLSFVANRFQLERKLRRANQAPNVSALAGAAQAAATPPVSAAPSPPAAPTPIAAASPAPEPSAVQPASFVATAEVAPPAAAAPIPPGGSADQVAVTRYFLAKWKHDCEARGARLIVAYIPGMVELGECAGEPVASNERAFRAAFFACADSLSIETLDLLPGMLAAKRERAAGLLAFPRDTHWNPTGHRVVAEIIAERVKTPTAADPGR